MAVFTETIQLQDKVTPVAKAAKSAIIELEGGLASANKQLVKAALVGDQAGYNKALEDMAKASNQLGKLKGNLSKQLGGQGASNVFAAADKEMQTSEVVKGDLWGDAAHAAEVGKASIGAAVDGIKNAFSALAQGDAQGAISGVTDAIAGMAQLLDLVVPGLGQLVSTVVKIAGGAAGIFAGMIEGGIKLAVSVNQAEDAAISMYDALGAGTVTGKQVKDMLDDLAESTGITDDKLEPMTKAFLKMGVTGVDELKKLTLAAASANAIVGEGGAEAFEGLQKKVQLAAETGGKFKLGTKQLLQLGEAGLQVSDIAAEMGVKTEDLAKGLAAGSVDAKKFGDAMTEAVTKKGAAPLEKMGNTWESISGMLSKSWTDMWKGMGPEVDDLMAAVRDFFSIFFTSKPSGEAMQAGIGGAFKSILTTVTGIIPTVKHFFLDVEIYALEAYVALKPYVKKLEELWDSAKKSGVLAKVFDALVVAAITIGVVIAAAVAILVALWAIMVTIGVAIWAVIGGMAALGQEILSVVVDAGSALVDALSGAWEQINEYFGGLPDMAVQAAEDFVQGLVDGITNGEQMLVDTVTNLGQGMLDTVKGVLHIASPSKAMHEVGGYIGEGLIGGIGAAANDVHGAAADMAGMAIKGADSVGAGGGAGGGMVLNVTVIVDGAGKSAEQITDDMVAATFEQYALAAGY